MNRYLVNRRVMALRQGGFGLLELLIALSILAIGTLGIMKLQMQSGLGNSGSRHQSAAVNLARSKMESLMRVRAYSIQEGIASEPGLEDPDSGNDLGNWASPDHSEGPFSEDKEVGGARYYTVSWNVVDDYPTTDIKSVRIRVSWTEGSNNRYVDLECQIGKKDLNYFQ